MNNKLRAIGFDLGDTLLFYRDIPMSWVSLYPEVLRSVGTACGFVPTPAQLDAAAHILSRYNTRITPRTNEVPSEEILSAILHSWQLDPAKHLSAATEAFFTFFQRQVSVYPETAQVLMSLRERALPFGILTDVAYGMPQAFVERDLDAAGISGLFDSLITSVEVGVRKPDPAGYLALAARLGVSPHEMLYIGNEPKDIIGACRAGMTAAFLDRASTRADHGQHFTVSTLSGLLDLVSRS